MRRPRASDTATGVLLGSLTWPSGNQIFAIDWLPRGTAPVSVRRRRKRATERAKRLFYAFRVAPPRLTRRVTVS